MRRPRPRMLVRGALVALVLLVGGATTAVVAARTERDLDQDAQDRFVASVDAIETRLRGNFVRYEDLVVAGAALLTGPEPSQPAWELLLEALQLRQRYPGASGMAYIRNEGNARRLALLAPPPPDPSLLGLDLSAVPELGDLQAMVEGQAQAHLTPPVPWFPSRVGLDIDSGHVLVLVAPVSNAAGALQGWVGVALSPERLARDLLDVEADVAVSLSTRTLDGAPTELVSTAPFSGHEALREVREVPLHGQIWTMEVRREAITTSGMQHPPTVVTVAGSLVTVLAATGLLLANALRDRRRASIRALAHQARHDGLTSLPNRAALQEHLAACLVRAELDGGSVAVLFVDLDRFKLLNDSLGHTIGDQVLCLVAARLQLAVRTGDLVARIGGDEFVVCAELAPGAGAPEAELLAERVREAIGEPLVLGGRELYLTASVGLRLGDGRTRLEDLVRDADVAMYHAKEAGRDRVATFEATAHAPSSHRLSLAADLRHAVERDELRLHLQPIHRLSDERIVGWEALVRWQHPRLGLLPPGQFVELAEDTGLIVGVGSWVLREALAWLASVPGHPGWWVTVNLSPRQLDAGGLPDLVEGALDASGLPAARLVVELTESALPRDGGADQLQVLRSRGVRVAVDDFGTGWSSLAALRDLPVDLLKLDRSFTQRLGAPRDDAVVTAVVQLGHALGLPVLAEGVERPEQLRRLRELGCDLAQGYHLGRPVAAREAVAIAARSGAGAPQLAPPR